MKKIGIFIAILAVAAVLMPSCSESSKQKADTTYATIEGEWHMVSYSGEMSENIDLYVKFNADRTFVEYQKLRFPYFVKYAGQYSITDHVLTGMYDDNTPFNSSYNVEFDSDNTRLTLSSVEYPDDITVFAREAIPSSVTDGAKNLTTRGEEVYNVKKFF